MINFFKRGYPYLLIATFNLILKFIFFNSYTVIYAPLDILLFSMLCWKSVSYLSNRYNILISKFWIIFFFLGILNINSAIIYDTTWKVNVHNASLLYFFNVFIFIISLKIFESKAIKINKRDRGRDFFIKNKLILITFLSFPILLLFTLYRSLGFLPILSGMNFVDDMYNYNYGPLYLYKFICVYSFLISVYFAKINKYRYMNIFFSLFVLFVMSVDGKRFLLLVGLLAFLPFNEFFNRLKQTNKKASYKTLLFIFLGILVIYVSILSLRVGNGVSDLSGLLINKIPFGIEFKDFVYSFERFNESSTKKYNFLLSNIGAFLNSGILSFFGYNKEQLTKMGSAYVWMDIYNINFGIRTGIVSELYFAYGLLGSFFMVPLAFFVNKTSFKLLYPDSIFNLIQHCILYALYILIINGQSTVFFGCLSLMMYVYLFKSMLFFIVQKQKTKY